MRSIQIFFFIFFLASAISWADRYLPKEKTRRIYAHLLIADYPSALREAKEALLSFPHSRELQVAYLTVLSRGGNEAEAIHYLEGHLDELKDDRQVLEEISWGVINKAAHSSQYNIRLASLIGAYLTQDAKGIEILVSMMRDTNAILRLIAVQLAANFIDFPIKQELARLMKEEKVWIVRIEVINAIGRIKMKDQVATLRKIASDERSTFEERAAAIEALVNIYDNIELKELKILAKSKRAGLRLLACEVATHRRIAEAKGEILALIDDPRSDVRIAALNALALFYLDICTKKEVLDLIKLSLEDNDPSVAITACWVAMLVDPPFGQERLRKWIYDNYEDNRRLAAGALAASGGRGTRLALEVLQKVDDPYVKANVALGLIGQRIEIKKCCDILFDFLTNKRHMWMWDSKKNVVFQIIVPSQIRHIDQIPNFPEAIDMITQLNLISKLIILEDSRSQKAIRKFLKQKTWGITGVAIVTLLQEGDEETMEEVKLLLKDKDKKVRVQAALVLALLGKDESAVPILHEAYSTADRDMKLYILEALGQIDYSSLDFSFFIKALREPFSILRVAAASSLIQALYH